MLVGVSAKEQTPLVEIGYEYFVGGLEEHSAHQRRLVDEGAVWIDRVDDGKPVAATTREVVCAEGRRLVHQSCSIICRDVVGEDDVVGVRDVHEVEGTPVSGALEVRPSELLDDLDVTVAEDV